MNILTGISRVLPPVVLVAAALLLAVSAMAEPQKGFKADGTKGVYPGGGAEGAPAGWVIIAPGTFTMGTPENEPGRDGDEVEREVTITRPFLMKATEVTQHEWWSLMKTQPSNFTGCGNNCPVETVGWWDSVAWCNAASRREGLEECYALKGCSGRPGSGYECSGVDFKGLDCTGYRLPTEAEWAYAARAGTPTALYTGPSQVVGDHNAPQLHAVAVYGGNSFVRYPGAEDCEGWGEQQFPAQKCGTWPVGMKAPNQNGLYDMVGNVWEWVHDYFDDEPQEGVAVTDPIGPSSGERRANRGCGYSSEAQYCRLGYREGDGPSDSYDVMGFRPVRTWK